MNRLPASLLAALLLTLSTTAAAQPVCTPAAVPYLQDFGAGTLDAAWRIVSSHGPLTQAVRFLARPPGRIAVTDQHDPFTPGAHPYQLAMDDPWAGTLARSFGTVYNAALLCADLAGQSGVYLHFHGWIYSAENARRPLSVYLSDDDGASFTLLDRYDGGFCPTGFFCWRDRVQEWVNLDRAAADAGLSFTDRWVIGFEHPPDGALPDDGATLDSVALSGNGGPRYEPIDLGDPREDHDRTVIDCPDWHPACQPAPCDGIDCPYRLDFEELRIDPRVTLLSVNGGTTMLGRDEAGYHLRMQALEGTGKHTINVALVRLDLSKRASPDPDGDPASPALSFAWQALDRASNDYDGVYLSDDGGARYVRVHSLDRTEAPLGTWQNVVLDLGALVDRHGLHFSDAFVVAFAHYALAGEGRAGYALDDIRIGRPDGKAGKTAAAGPAPLPSGFALEASYPNPFNPSTSIPFVLPEAAAVTLTVYDVYGREVARLLDGQVVAAGAHTVDFAAGHLPSGTYVYRLTAGRFTASRRMVLVK